MGPCHSLAHGTNHSTEVAIYAHNFKGKCVFIQMDTDGHVMDRLFVLCNVYGYCSSPPNNLLLEEIEEILKSLLRKYPSSQIIVGGDFNMVYSDDIDRLPHRPNIGMNKLVNFCQSLDLIDKWRVNNPGEKQYTWSNRDRSLQ